MCISARQCKWREWLGADNVTKQTRKVLIWMYIGVTVDGFLKPEDGFGS